jgi:hypothetical protein
MLCACGGSSGSPPPASPTITIAPLITAGVEGLVASVGNPVPGQAYTWNGDFGTVTSGQGSDHITFTAGVVGTRGVSVLATSAAGATATGTASVVVIAPTTPCVFAVPSDVTTGRVGLSAATAPQPGATRYQWAVTGDGNITSGDTTASVIFTAPTVLGPGSLSCSACNAAGDCAAPLVRAFTVAARGYSLLYGSNGTSGDAFALSSQSQSSGSVRFNSPRGMATMTIGGLTHLLVADTGNNCVREAVGDAVTVFAAIDCNPAGGTLLNAPQGVAASRRIEPNPLDLHDVVVADDANNCIRWFTRGAGTAAQVMAVGLCGSPPGTANGGPATARFNAPKDVVIDRARNAVYVAEYGNHSVRRIDLNPPYDTTTILGVPGTAGNDVTTTPADCLAPLHVTNPHGLALSRDGAVLFIAGNDNNLPIRMDLNTNTCARVGTATGLFRHATVDFSGSLMLTSTPSNVVVDFSNAVVVGDPLMNGVLLNGGLLSDPFDDPDGITVDPVNGDLFVTSSTKHAVMRVRH